jgi:hypothetical protein
MTIKNESFFPDWTADFPIENPPIETNLGIEDFFADIDFGSPPPLVERVSSHPVKTANDYFTDLIFSETPLPL